MDTATFVLTIVTIIVLLYGFISEYFKRQKLQEELNKLKDAKHKVD